MLKLSMTYETITHESAENGEVEDCGFVFEKSETTVHELADYILKDGFNSPSQSRGVPRWLTAYGDPDCFTGDIENRSIHPGEDAQSQKVWERVLKITGII